jgi:hypothetical protein
LVHGALNGLATGLYIMSWLDRHRGRHGRGIVTSALGYGITVSASYMGGALVFASGIGIDQSGERLRTPDWTPVLAVESLKNGKPQRVEVDGVGLVLCRTGTNDEVAAFGEFCPHLAAPMTDGLGRPWPAGVSMAWVAIRRLLRSGSARPLGGAVAAL